MKVNAYAARGPKEQLTPFQYDCVEPQSKELQIEISHCGICHSDIHLIDNDWKNTKYPLVPGHEIVGTVVAVGKEVPASYIGKRVGVGWQRSSCFECEWCLTGHENMCSQADTTTKKHFGGFADRINIDSRFAFPIPDELSSENAAPLLCGGITVFSPLILNDIGALSKVAVVGIGGLGHLAIQFADAFGCEVTAISSSDSKQQEARSLGADHFVLGSDLKALGDCASSFDIIIVSAAADLDWMTYIKALRPFGKLCFVGVVPSPISIPAGALIHGSKSVCGSNIGDRPAINQMLHFAALHNIKAQVEVVPFSSVNEAIERVRMNKARYRMVLKMK